MKTVKTCITNPELVKVGQNCEVRMSTRWMEMNLKEPYIYLPAKIKYVNYGVYSNFPSITLYVRKCSKRHNYWPVENLWIAPSEIGKINEDGTIEDSKIIIFK